MATAVNDLTSAFLIKERTGQKRTLRLRERALPYRPFELGGTQRNVIEWYPGSPIGTLQVFGAKEEQTTINGMWKDAFLTSPTRGTAPAELDSSTTEQVDGEDVSGVASEALTTARDLVKAIDSIRRCGQEVEVSWLDQVRRGILERFTAKFHTGHDVEWEAMFSWTSQGESHDDVKMVDDTASDLGDIPNKVQGLLARILSTAADVIQQADDRSSDVLNKFNTLSAKIADLSDELTDAVVNVSQALSTPNEILKRVAGILDGIKLEADDMVSLLEDQVDPLTLDSGRASIISSLQRNFGVTLGIRADARERSAAAAELRSLAAQQQNALLTRVTSTIINTFQARDGQDLRQVALEFYGTSDAWRGLMVYNNLRSSGLRAGQVVFVPAQPPDGNC